MEITNEKIIITDNPVAEIRGPQIQTGIEVPGFDTSGGRPILAMHSFYVDARGLLIHTTDGYLRATVSPEWWDVYAESWPNAWTAINAARHSFLQK